jgi:hypothetical protein
MRTFLAPYRFDIKHTDIETLLGSLEELQAGYRDEKSSLFLRLNSFETQKRSISGTIEYGTYGNDENVINIDTSRITKHIENNESPLKKYYFIFEFIEKDRGILILERKGNIGVRSIFYQGLKKNLEQKGGDIEISPISIGLNKILDKPLKKIVIKLPSIPKEIDAKLGGIKIENVQSINFELVITAKKNQTIISELIETLKEQWNNYKKLDVGIIYDQNEEISIFVDDGNFKRTVYIKRNSFRSWIEVETGQSVILEAKKFIQEIKSSEEILQVLKINSSKKKQ